MAQLIPLTLPPNRHCVVSVAHIREVWPSVVGDAASGATLYLDPYEGNAAPTVTVTQTVAEVLALANA